MGGLKMYFPIYEKHEKYPYGIESTNENGETLDCFWYETEAERDNELKNLEGGE